MQQAPTGWMHCSSPHHSQAIDTQLMQILPMLSKNKCTMVTRPQSYLQHQFWSIKFSAKCNNKDMKDVLQALQARLHPSPEDHLELTRSLSENLCHAQKVLQKQKQEADLLRKQHIEVQLQQSNCIKQAKKPKALWHLIQDEQNWPCYASLRQHTKPKLSGSLAYGTWQEPNEQHPTILLDKEELDDTLLECSQQHFTIAQGTPFTTEPLLHLLHYNGLMPFGDRILHGCNDYAHLPFDKLTKTLLKHMKDKMT